MPREELPRRLAAILSADVVGHTRLMAADEVATLHLLRSHREVLEQAIARNGGRVVDAVGDNLLAEFPSAVRAVECAVQAQREVAARNADAPAERRLAFRIGIHVGDVIVDGERIAGVGVNTAARIQSLADAGGVAVSGAVFEQVSGKPGLAFESLGEKSLKNLDRPVLVYRVQIGERVSAEPGPAVLSPGAETPGIAVLPFENLSGDPEQQYLADGIADDLINHLARWALRVAARAASFAFRDRRPALREIERELHVRYLVDGTVRRSGAGLRITANLVDLSTGTTLWSRQWNRTASDPFAVEDEMVFAIERAIGMRISRNEEDRALRTPLASLGAWEYAARASWHAARYTLEDWRLGLAAAKHALELDPRFAWAHALVAALLVDGVASGWPRDPDATRAEALEAARTAVALDPGLPIGHEVLAMAAFLAGDSRTALASIERAIAIAPSWIAPRGILGWMLALSGKHEEAIPILEELVRTGTEERVVAGGYVSLALAQFTAGRSEVALAWAERAYSDRDDPLRRGLLAAILATLGRADEAKKLLVPAGIYRIRNVAPIIAHMDRGLVTRLLDGLRAAGAEE
jgi:adenylate cyclase